MQKSPEAMCSHFLRISPHLGPAIWSRGCILRHQVAPPPRLAERPRFCCASSSVPVVCDRVDKTKSARRTDGRRRRPTTNRQTEMEQRTRSLHALASSVCVCSPCGASVRVVVVARWPANGKPVGLERMQSSRTILKKRVGTLFCYLLFTLFCFVIHRRDGIHLVSRRRSYWNSSSSSNISEKCKGWFASSKTQINTGTRKSQLHLVANPTTSLAFGLPNEQ